MNVTVKLFGVLRYEEKPSNPKKELDITLPDAARVADLLDHPDIQTTGANVVIINGCIAKKDDTIEKNAEISIVPYAGGG